MIIGKIAEVPIVLIAITGFYFQNFFPVMAAILMMGLQSSLFSPSKYGLVKEIRGEEGISFGTGVMEMLAFIGVLSATILASIISENYNLRYLSFAVLIPAFIGILSAILIKANETETEKDNNESINPIKFIRKNYLFSKKIKGLNDAIFGSALFWLLGSLITMNLPIFCPARYSMNNTETSIAMAIAAIGIAAGSVFIGLISNKKVRMAYVLIGTLGFAVSMFFLVLFNPEKEIFLIVLFIASATSGIFKIPLNSYIQANVKGRQLGDVLAFQNIMEFTLISISAFLFWLINYLVKDNGLAIFLVSGIIALLAAIYFYLKVEEVKKDLKRMFKIS